MTTLLLAIIYLAFISLGLPDGLLGAAWPSIYPVFGVPVSSAGLISMVIAAGTIVSALLSDRITCRFGAGKVTATSVAITCIALFGFSFSSNYYMLILWAIPYGLGAGGVDAALNNYVALHYSSRHMSWLHCMWGIGASLGPYLMSLALSLQSGAWQMGYRFVGGIQVVLTLILVFSLPLWKSRPTYESGAAQAQSEPPSDSSVPKEPSAANTPLSLSVILRIPGVPAVLITFFCYCALEGTAGLWAASFLHLTKGIDATTAASLAALFYIGITVGRAINGLLTIKFSDAALIRLGQGIILTGIIIMLLPFSVYVSFAGIILVGLGCAPIYPCIIHSTPMHFGADKSQAIVGVQMASAYIGTLSMPPLFGLLGQNISMGVLPFFLLVILVIMVIAHERLEKITDSIN